MKRAIFAGLVLALVLAFGGSTAAVTAAPPGIKPIVRTISASSTIGSIPAGGNMGPDVYAGLDGEVPAGIEDSEASGGSGGVNRSLSGPAVNSGPTGSSAGRAKSNPSGLFGFDGLNFRDQRTANGGNQFSVEPPDQGLCAGNGYVLESVNDVMRVFNTSGAALSGAIDLNTFLGYPAAINRTTGVRGPFVTDPSCLFDQPTGRWFHVVLTLDVDPATGGFLGSNHLDIAVSKTPDPRGDWTIYRVPVQDDGTDGTPNHGCSYGPCIGDYPHIGADANGFYVTTNEYSLFGPEYKGAQVYAFSKTALAAGAPSVTMLQFDTSGAVAAGNPGFTIWPAISAGNVYAGSAGGTEYFLSSDAAEEAQGANYTGRSNHIFVWAVTNTSSLNTANPNVTLSNTMLTVNEYVTPPQSDQKAGPFPLGQCLNDNKCWQNFFAKKPKGTEVESHLDSNDTRMQQVYYANGRLWAALDTAVTVGGQNKAGIAWYIITPNSSNTGVTASLHMQGYLAMAGNNLTYPAVAVTSSGRGVMAFTLVGQDYFPTAAFAPIDALVGVGDVQIAAMGAAPDDGFTSYKAFVGDPPRTRWGDYGAAVVVGNDIWLASEYIAHSCTLSEYIATGFSCGGTRTSLGNWATRVSRVTP